MCHGGVESNGEVVQKQTTSMWDVELLVMMSRSQIPSGVSSCNSVEKYSTSTYLCPMKSMCMITRSCRPDALATFKDDPTRALGTSWTSYAACSTQKSHPHPAVRLSLIQMWQPGQCGPGNLHDMSMACPSSHPLQKTGRKMINCEIWT